MLNILFPRFQNPTDQRYETTCYPDASVQMRMQLIKMAGRTHGCLNKLLFFLFLYYFSFSLHHKQGISKRVIHHQLWFQARPITEPRQVVLERPGAVSLSSLEMCPDELPREIREAVEHFIYPADDNDTLTPLAAQRSEHWGATMVDPALPSPQHQHSRWSNTDQHKKHKTKHEWEGTWTDIIE